MTLVLSYVDASRVIQVADQRITLTDAAGVESVHDDDSIKAFPVRGSMVATFCGLAELDDGISTMSWVRERLEQATDDIEKSLKKIAAGLPKVIHPSFSDEPLDIKVTGVALDNDGQLAVCRGAITNLSAGKVKQVFLSEGKQVGIHEAGKYRSLGGQMPGSVAKSLSQKLMDAESLPAVEIVNHFLWAIRSTHHQNKYVGPTVMAVVLPFDLYADHVETASIDVGVNPFGGLLDEAIAVSRAPEDVAEFVSVPRAAAHVNFDDGPLDLTIFSKGEG